MSLSMRSIKILVVEDEGLIALDLADLLTGFGHTVCAIARSAEEAVSAAEALRPDLVVTDIRLAHGSSGLEAARRIRSSFGIPSCFLSGSLDQAVIDEARLSLPVAILQKPLRPLDLEVALARAFPAAH